MTARSSATAVELVASLPPTAQPVRAAVFAILAAVAALTGEPHPLAGHRRRVGLGRR